MILQQMSSWSHWQIDLVAFWLLLQGAVLSLAPEEVVIITLGLFWGQGKLGFSEALLSVLLGLLPANLIMVYLGERLSRRFAGRESVQLASDYVRRYGAWLIFVTRFTPIVRAPVYFSSGAARFGMLRFFRIDGLAACVQVPMLLYLGFTLGQDASRVDSTLRSLGWSAAALFSLSVVFTLTMEIRRRTRVAIS